MTITAPYSEDAEDRIRFSTRHVLTATAYPINADPIELDVEDAQIQFDDSWSPHIQATLTCKVPEDQTILDALDARKTLRVSIFAGYVYDSVTEDVHLLADLHVRSREVKRPSNRMVLRCWSDEGLAQDFKRMAWDNQPPQSGINEFVQWHANIAVFPVPSAVVVSDFPAGYDSTFLTGITQDPGQDSWTLINEVAARAGLWVYCTGDRTWRITTKPEVVGETALNMTVGGGGIITDSTSEYTRETFHNLACLKYAWKDSSNVDHVVYGQSYISSGPYSQPVIGWNTYYEERSLPATQAQADAAATAVVKSQGQRGRNFSISSVAAYWLRPGMTVTATLPTGEQERLLVSSVNFHPLSGAMDVGLRQPETITTSSTAPTS